MLLVLLAALWLPAHAETPRPSPAWRSLLLARTELPDSQNALTRWRPLFPHLFSEDPGIVEQLQHALSPLSDAPAPGSPLQAWIASLSQQLAELTLRPGESLQLPRLHGPETPFPDHQPLRQLTQLRIVAMKLAWRDGRADEALALARENLALSRTLLSTQEGIIPLIVANGIWQLSLDGVYWLARQPDLSPEQAAGLQALLPADEPLASRALTRAFQGEFTFFTHLVIERLPRTHDVELLLSSIGSFGMVPPVAPPEGEPRLAVTERNPFDREATLQASAEDVQGWIEAFTTRRHPHGLSATHSRPRLLGYAGEIRQLLRLASQDGMPSLEQIAAVQTELETVENPVGKLFLVITTSQWESLSASVFRREAQRSALTGLLAWRRFGHPAPWKELIAAGLLAEPPADPFTREALYYDLENPRIWSAGENGTDEGGAGNGENIGRPDDLTWPAK